MHAQRDPQHAQHVHLVACHWAEALKLKVQLARLAQRVVQHLRGHRKWQLVNRQKACGAAAARHANGS